MDIVNTVKLAQKGKRLYSRNAKLYIQLSEETGGFYPDWGQNFICNGAKRINWSACPTFKAMLAKDWRVINK